jgi:GNAT superfamily N-acetyltransferase
MDLTGIVDSRIGGQVRIQLSLRRELTFPEHRLVEQWHASAYFTDDNDDPNGEGQVIGHAHVVKCRLGEPQVFDILDSLEADLHTVSAAVIDPATGDPAEDVEDAVEGFGQDFLILNRVHMAKGWRGRGLGRWFAAEVIDSLSPGAAFAATYPAPMDDSQGLIRKTAEAKLRSVWSDIGFQTLSGDVMILDLNLVTFEDRVRTMRKKFGAD